MTSRSRLLTYGSAGLLVISGAVCGALISGGVGPVLAFPLIGLGRSP